MSIRSLFLCQNGKVTEHKTLRQLIQLSGQLGVEEVHVENERHF